MGAKILFYRACSFGWIIAFRIRRCKKRADWMEGDAVGMTGRSWNIGGHTPSHFV